MITTLEINSSTESTIFCTPNLAVVQDLHSVMKHRDTSTQALGERIYFIDRLLRLKKNKIQVESYALLPDNWNSYGAKSISKEVVSRTIRVLELLKYQPKTFPTGRNSIQLEFHVGETYLEVEVFEDSITYLLEKDGEETENTIEINDLSTLVESIYA